MEIEVPQRDFNPMLGIAIVAALAAALIGMFYFSPEQRALRACEDVLKDKLKAPATYHRVDYLSSSDGRSVSITYDAENSFGAPIRGVYFCSLDANFRVTTDVAPDLPLTDSGRLD